MATVKNDPQNYIRREQLLTGASLSYREKIAKHNTLHKVDFNKSKIDKNGYILLVTDKTN